MTEERKPYPSEVQDRYILTFPDGMRDVIRERATKTGRSLNAEVIHLAQLGLTLNSLNQKAPLDQNQLYLQQKEFDRVTTMYRRAIENQYNLEECYEKGYWGMDAFIPLGDDRYAFINHKDQVVWAYEGEFDTKQRQFIPSEWNLEISNWEGLDFEHPATAYDLELIDASHFQPQPNSTPKI